MNESRAHDSTSAREVVGRIPDWALLVAGAVLVAASGYRWGVAVFAWLAPVPFLLYAARRTGWRARALLLGVMTVATCAQIAKLVTDPLPLAVIIPFALPLALTGWLAIVAWAAVRRRIGEVAALYTYPAAVGLIAWVGYALLPLGTWGTGASMETDSLALLQLGSVLGVPGIGFVMAWAASALVFAAVEREPRRLATHLGAFATALALVFAFGSVRLFAGQGERTLTVAAVTTDVGLSERGMPSEQELVANTDSLFDRSRIAAERGARLVVWNEVATVVPPASERALVERGRIFARAHGVDLVLAYGVSLSTDPLLLANRYAWIGSEGAVLETYDKHHPVPGEPSRRGTAELAVLERPYGRVAGAICYDYDFPTMAVEHARLGAELVVVPSSDWRGIDPFHTEMARQRAIEGGFSVLRSTRWAASAAFDAHGRIRGWMDASGHVMVATLPIGRIPTVYGRIGDTPVALAAAYLFAMGLLALRGRRPTKQATPSRATA